MNPEPREGVLARWRLSDLSVLGILSMASIAFASRSFATPVALRLAVLHSVLLATFLAGRFVCRPRASQPGRPGAYLALKFALLMTLYTSLGVGGLAVFHWGGDAALCQADRWLFGGAQPSLMAAGLATPFGTEALSLVYGWFIPFLYLSVLTGSIGRPPAERERFFDGLALLYALSYLGYLFFPAQGPIEYLASAFAAPIPDGPIHQQVLRSVASTGGNLGAFPSLHVGVSVYNCLFDLRYNRLRGLTYVLPVALIGVATVVLRYHYVVDVLAGALLAVVVLLTVVVPLPLPALRIARRGARS